MAMVKENFVFKAFKPDGTVPSPGEKIIEITVKDRYSMVSLISVLAPSPDWFVGIDSLDLCGSDGMWRDDVMMDLKPWDAGTDSGENFNSDNMKTMPYDLISRITQNSTLKEDANKAFAKITFEKKFVLMSSPTSVASAASSIVTSELSSTESRVTAPTKTPTENSALQKTCGSVSLVFAIIVLMQGLLTLMG